MNRDEIIRMVQEEDQQGAFLLGYEQGRRHEREACAQLCFGVYQNRFEGLQERVMAQKLGERIMERGEKK